jgi:hypothetical protein
VLQPNLIGTDLNIIVGYEFLSRFSDRDVMLVATDVNADACTDGKSMDEPRTARRGNCTEGYRRWMGGWVGVLQSAFCVEMCAGWA